MANSSNSGKGSTMIIFLMCFLFCCFSCTCIIIFSAAEYFGFVDTSTFPSWLQWFSPPKTTPPATVAPTFPPETTSSQQASANFSSGGNVCTTPDRSVAMGHVTSLITDVEGKCKIQSCEGNYYVNEDQTACVYGTQPPYLADCSQGFQQSQTDICMGNSEAGFKWHWTPATQGTCQPRVGYYLVDVYSSRLPDSIYQIKLDSSMVPGGGNAGRINSVGIKNLWEDWYKNDLTFTIMPYDKQGRPMLTTPTVVPVSRGNNTNACNGIGVKTYDPVPQWNRNSNLMKINVGNWGGGNMSGWLVSTMQQYPYKFSENVPGLTDKENLLENKGSKELNVGTSKTTYIPKGGTLVPWCDAPLAGYQNWDAKPSWDKMIEDGADKKGYVYTVRNECLGGGGQTQTDYHAGP